MIEFAVETVIAPSGAGDIRVIPVAQGLAATALLEEHWQEVALNKDLMRLKPLPKVYEALEASGKLLSLGAFVGDELVGYSATLVVPHLHYGDLIYANNDVLFLAARHRHSSLGLRLIRETERQAKLRGARLMCWHAKPGSALDALLARKGYAVQDIIYSKEL